MVALLVAFRFWSWCRVMRSGALIKLPERLGNVEVLHNCALPRISVLFGFEWILSPVRLPVSPPGR